MPRPPVRPDMTSVHLVLVGLMGSGKSSVGRRVADVLNRPFVDTDHRIEKDRSRTVREIFETEGEEAFRDLETRILGEVLSAPTPSVVATGGGVVLRPGNRRLLHDHRVVWLRASVDTLIARVGPHSSRRPLLDGDARQRLLDLENERRDLYRDVASLVVDVDTLELDDVVDVIVQDARRS